jgi:hypothetical protein
MKYRAIHILADNLDEAENKRYSFITASLTDIATCAPQYLFVCLNSGD